MTPTETIEKPATEPLAPAIEPQSIPLDRILAGIHADAKNEPSRYLAESEVPDGGE
jgi:hypothetical protein